MSPEAGAPSGEDVLATGGTWGRENGTMTDGDRLPQEGEKDTGKESGGETGGSLQPEEEEEDEQEEGEEEESAFKPFILPGE